MNSRGGQGGLELLNSGFIGDESPFWAGLAAADEIHNHSPQPQFLTPKP